MDKKKLESYLIRKGWRKESGGIYEKEPVPLRRLKLLKTSIRLETRGIGRIKWKKAMLVYYEDLELDFMTDKLYVLNSKSTTLL